MDQIVFLTEILFPALIGGTVITLELIAVTAPIGLLLGIAIAVGRTYGSWTIVEICKGYVIFFKGCPLLLLLFILYFGFPTIGITFTAFTAAVIGFICCNSAYNSEYIRGAMLSVQQGQLIAAKALGMTKRQAIINIVLPQALRRAIPGISNEFIYLIKYSSLAYVITVIELTGSAKQVATKYFMYTETFIIVALFYLAIVTVATIGINAIEKRVAIPGFVQK
ncbi:MAG: amino acid ABC transporter permease [Methanospirillaceae archaeon]|nr:amino acid ABC transporter permease [Methanospirillaceae archaeon]